MLKHSRKLYLEKEGCLIGKGRRLQHFDGDWGNGVIVAAAEPAFLDGAKFPHAKQLVMGVVQLPAGDFNRPEPRLGS